METSASESGKTHSGVLGGGADFTIHRHATDAGGIFANAYFVETPSGIVAIDSTLTETDSRALRGKAESLGKPLLAVLLTHGHPDHYNGVTNLLGPDLLPVFATGGVDRVIRASDAAKEEQWRPLFGPEWPERRTFPNRLAADGEELIFDGVGFRVHDLGPGESHSDSVWIAVGASESAAFVGDCVMRGVHAYVADGHTGRWLTNLVRLRGLLETSAGGVRTIYPGHGEPGGVELLEEQRRYLVRYRREIAALANGRPSLTPAETAELAARMKQELPTDRLEFLIDMGADAVARELASVR